MTKFICDRCGKEAEYLATVRFPVERTAGFGCSTKTIELCKKCNFEFAKFETALLTSIINLKLSMYDNFINRGAENGNTEKDN